MFGNGLEIQKIYLDLFMFMRICTHIIYINLNERTFKLIITQTEILNTKI
jgi:hypothetical protein